MACFMLHLHPSPRQPPPYLLPPPPTTHTHTKEPRRRFSTDRRGGSQRNRVQPSPLRLGAEYKPRPCLLVLVLPTAQKSNTNLPRGLREACTALCAFSVLLIRGRPGLALRTDSGPSYILDVRVQVLLYYTTTKIFEASNHMAVVAHNALEAFSGASLTRVAGSVAS